jgi:transglutaminase-like putative cysteine protease
LIYQFPQPTPVILVLNIHHSRTADLILPDQLITEPFVPVSSYTDSFGNRCSRLVAPAGRIRLHAEGIITVSEHAEPPVFAPDQTPVAELPDDTLQFLLGSRYCETDLLSQTAWQLFGWTVPGHLRVQAICDFVHNHIRFNYQNACCTRSASGAYQEATGVCRDFAHLAITFCRCMNIPARYCTGYLSDIGLQPPFDPGDFAAWMEVWINGQWHTFDPRNNTPRAGRILMARGRDAADVAIATTFGPNILESFRVWADEIPVAALAPPAQPQGLFTTASAC